MGAVPRSRVWARALPASLSVSETCAKSVEPAESPRCLCVALGVPAGALTADAGGQLLGPRQRTCTTGRGVQVQSGGGGPERSAAGAHPGSEPGVLELPEEVEDPVGGVPGREAQESSELAGGGGGVA